LVRRSVAVRQSLGSQSGDLDSTVGQQQGREITADTFGLL
jgi:allophanate hydrolase subunit 2